MKKVTKCAVSDVSMVDDDLLFTVHYTGSFKDQEVGTAWSVSNINLRVKYRVKAIEALAVCGSAEWIALQAKLRKTDKAFCDSIGGNVYSAGALEALIDAATPDTAGSGAKAQAAKLREMLKGMGLSDSEIDAKLAAM